MRFSRRNWRGIWSARFVRVCFGPLPGTQTMLLLCYIVICITSSDFSEKLQVLLKQCAELSDRLHNLQLTEESILNSPRPRHSTEGSPSANNPTDPQTISITDEPCYKRPHISPRLKSLVTQSPESSVPDQQPVHSTTSPASSNLEPVAILRQKNANIELKNIAIRWSQLLTEPATSDSFTSVAILDSVSLVSSNDACSLCDGNGSCRGSSPFVRSLI